MRRVDWFLAVTAIAGFALAWLARTYELGGISTRASIIGIGKAIGYLFLILFFVQLIRSRRSSR